MTFRGISMPIFDLDDEPDDEDDDEFGDDEDSDDENGDDEDDDEEEPETWQVHARGRRHAKAGPSLDFRF